MADDFDTNPGSGGTRFASDELSGSPPVHVPRIKVMLGADGTNDGDISDGNPAPVKLVADPALGLDLFRSLDLDESEEQIKATAGCVYFIRWQNRSAAERFLKFYNATAASVTVGTTAPVLTLSLPAGQGETVAIPHGLAFDTAITVAATTGIADSDTGAPDANDVLVNIGYK